MPAPVNFCGVPSKMSFETRSGIRRPPHPSRWSLNVAGTTPSITVSDSGPGVPDKDLPHLFEPFYRVAEARDRGTGGTGLGLAITDRTVRLHGGAVEAFNRPKGGLSISISFPQGRGANSIAESGGQSLLSRMVW